MGPFDSVGIEYFEKAAQLGSKEAYANLVRLYFFFHPFSFPSLFLSFLFSSLSIFPFPLSIIYLFSFPPFSLFSFFFVFLQSEPSSVLQSESYNLQGIIHLEGLNGNKDQEQAMKYFRTAGKLGKDFLPFSPCYSVSLCPSLFLYPCSSGSYSPVGHSFSQMLVDTENRVVTSLRPKTTNLFDAFNQMTKIKPPKKVLTNHFREPQSLRLDSKGNLILADYTGTGKK